MQLEDNIELSLEEKKIEKQILSIFQEIKEGYLVDCNDILEDLNPLMSQLGPQDKNKVVQALNKYFRDHEFVRNGGYWLQGTFDLQEEIINYTLIYNQDRITKNYQSILDKMRLKNKSLLVFDLLDYYLYKKDLTQTAILKILLELFCCNSIFTDDESTAFEQLIGSLLQKQLYEISYYIQNLKNNDPQNYKNFVQFFQQLQLKIINESNSDLRLFLETNQRYKILLNCFSTHIRCYISNIENVNDQLNDLYLLTILYYWKKYCMKFNLQIDLKSQEDSLPNIIENERKFKFIERYLNKQKSNSNDNIFLFVIQRICYFVEDIDNILCKDNYQQFMNKITMNVNNYQYMQNYLIQTYIQDKSQFFEYWKVIHQLQFYQQQISQQSNQSAKLITNLLWIYNQNVSLFNIVNMIMSNKKKESFLNTVKLIEKEINKIYIDSNDMDVNILKMNFVRIIYAEFPQEENNYLLLRSLIENYGSLLRAEMILEANKFINNKLSQESISFFAKIGIKFIVIHKVFPSQTLSNLANELFDYLTSDNQAMIQIYECLLSLKSIFKLKQLALSEDLQSIKILSRNFCTNLLGYLILINRNQNISLTQIKLTIYAIFNLFQKIDENQFQKVEKCIYKLFKDKCYNFLFVFYCLRNKIDLKKICIIVQLQYYLCYNQQDKLVYLSQELFQQDGQLYEEWFKVTQPSQVMLSIEYLKVKSCQSYYPKKLDILLEEFNISLSEYGEQEQKLVLSNWIQDMTDAQKFRQIIPLFFNIIKRGESPRDVLIFANQILQNQKKIADGIGCFNLKSLFQIFFNNANEELRVILMKFFSKEFPIPFIYQNPILDNLISKTELLLLNNNLFYFIDQGYTIINFCLSQNQKKIGKTELINQIFYEREKFETSDTCQMNSNTIDIMFDFEFNNSRNFIVADAHGTIIFEILIKILPFFKFWIVQMDSQKELKENLDQISIILQQISQQIQNQLEICFIVRNTEEKELVNQQKTFKIENQNIYVFYISNLTANQIDKQFKISQIQEVSKFLFNKILDHQKILEQSNQLYQNHQNQFLFILQQFNSQYAFHIQQIIQHQNLVNKIQDKLNQIVNDQDGFYSQNAFPIRRIQWNIKKLRNKHYELCMKPQENKQEIEKIKYQMKDQEKLIQKQNPTEFLKLFCEIFNQKHYYIVYLWIVDKIRQFNEKNLINLQQNDFQLNGKFNNLKQEKHKIKQKYLNDLQRLCEDPRNKKIKDEMSQLKQQMKYNAQNISQKNVAIELFWRELISLRKSIYNNLEFDPVETLSQLIRKGESLEFLDGDTLSINTEFLFDLENKITQNKQQKTLVISILGPQSSGKSTILNKIFGCHFWASVGRCTKGIHLQIFQVQNKQLFQNRFDQILILDTEGLQNPNQIDPEFDKKIALFVLSISDIIMINVKGEINQQFKNLVEMCIFTLGHLKNGLSVFKQLTWFFNQNDNYKNVQPFRQQIKDIAQNLNLQWNENYFDKQEEYIDYADILDIKDNIFGLGFASDQKDWGKNGWNQSVNNHTFSREAYQQGINMIKQFVSKLQDQSDPLNNFYHFIQNVQRNWESIEKLPDLLEFSELIQHQQNLTMRKYFDDLWKMQNITQVGEDLYQDTIQKIQSKGTIVFDVYKEIKMEQENEIQSTYTQIKTQIVEKMNQFKSENKIQKKIMQKYSKKLENLIKTQELDCKFEIQNLIQNYEGEYQKKIGYIKIDNFIQEVLNDELMKKKYQGNDKLIESEFKKKWEEFISETKRSSEQQYLEMVDTQYKAIKSISTQYILNTKNESDYIIQFRDEIIKSNPYDIASGDQERIFQLFQREFYSTEQFISIHSNTNLSYIDIFHQKIQEKLTKSKDQLLDMKQFYSKEIIYSVVAKVDIQTYLSNQFENDFQLFLKKNENQSNLKSYYFSFMSILDYLQISFDQKPKKQLENIISNPSCQQQVKQLFTNKCTQEYEAFQDLKKSLKFKYNNNKKEIDLSGTKIGETFKQTYLGLKVTQIIDQQWDNNQQCKKEIQQKYIIIGTQIEIQSSQNQFSEFFNYIKQPQVSTPQYFRANFPKQFNSIMIQLNGWNKLYKELYQLIKQEIGSQKTKIEQEGSKSNQFVHLNNNKEDENIQSFNTYLIASIMQKVKNNIKVKYNNYFAQFGVILTDVGERCIQYYSMLIIWRFFCYQRWNSKYIQQKHQNNYQDELNRCIAEINQDNQKQSRIQATELVSKIQITLQKQFLVETKKLVLQKMNQLSMSNVELIAKLDKELLIDVNENKFQDDKFTQQILSYTTDHKSYINKYVQDMLTQSQVQLLNEYSNKYREVLRQYLKSIQENAKILYKYIENQKKEVKTRKYFDENNDKKQDKQFYENYLFRLLMQCLFGRIKDKINIIDPQYKEIFQVSNYYPVNSEFSLNLQVFKNQSVYNLKTFVETLIEQIDLILNNIDQIQFNQNEYQLDAEFCKLKFQLNGCEYTCPCCKRKCDQDNDNNHIHQCQNGHQIRGINGILITKNSPSLFICEEIHDQCMIKTLETNLQKTWKEVKKAHPNWDFKYVFLENSSENRVKWKNIWNMGLGKLVCQQLENQLNHKVLFKQKSEFENQVSNIHYILILDDSGSMGGDKWEKAKNGALNCIKQLETIDSAKVSVIIFNGKARIVTECQKPKLNEINNKIIFTGGGTLFEPPFRLALELIQKHKGFNKISILFYTDGGADYPTNIVDQFCQLPQEIRSLINLTACSGEKSSQSLELMIDKFQQNMQSAQLRNSVQPIDIQRVWTEVVSKNIHSQLA